MKDNLKQELAAAGANQTETIELVGFLHRLKKPVLVRSQTFKLSQVGLILSRTQTKVGWQQRLVRFLAPVSVALAGLFSGVMVVAAAQTSLPGDPLYSIKKTSEAVMGSLNAKFAREAPLRRSEEVKELVKKKADQQSLQAGLNAYRREALDKEADKQAVSESTNNLQEAEHYSSGNEQKEIKQLLLEIGQGRSDKGASNSAKPPAPTPQNQSESKSGKD